MLSQMLSLRVFSLYTLCYSGLMNINKSNKLGPLRIFLSVQIRGKLLSRGTEHDSAYLKRIYTHS